MRNNKGITLVVLITTVIVMLILLGVSVSFILNEDGIVEDAQNAKEQVENQIKEQEQWTQNIINEF